MALKSRKEEYGDLEKEIDLKSLEIQFWIILVKFPIQGKDAIWLTN